MWRLFNQHSAPELFLLLLFCFHHIMRKTTEVEQMINNASSSPALRNLIIKGFQVVPATLLPFCVSNCWVSLNKVMLTASSLEKNAAFSWDVQRELWSAAVLGWGSSLADGPSLGQCWIHFQGSWNQLCLMWRQLLVSSHRAHSCSPQPLPCKLSTGGLCHYLGPLCQHRREQIGKSDPCVKP